MRLARPLVCAALACTLGPWALRAQSLMYRPPNLGGTWVPPGGVLQFNFLHRFLVAPAPTHKVSNYPTFTFAMGLGHGMVLGTRYASNSTLIPGNLRPNELELFGRVRLGAAEGGNGVSVAVTPAYNSAARSFDGELAVDFTRGPLTLSGAGRFMQKTMGADDARAAIAGGASLRVNDYIALDGDVAKLFLNSADPAWSAGLSFVIPGSPHTFSLHAGKSTSTTIQGASISVNRVIYGFEFTIPIHFSRFAPWFKRRERAITVNGPFVNAAAEVVMGEFHFAADSVVITAGQAVRWVNRDPVAHTVTFDSQAVQSSGEVPQNGSFVVTFARPGTYRYHCVPHPMMKGVIVVQ